MKLLYYGDCNRGIERDLSSHVMSCSDDEKTREKHKPGIQMQVNSPRPSMQVPRFLQGLESHSLTFISHLGPEYPCEVESEIHGSLEMTIFTLGHWQL